MIPSFLHSGDKPPQPIAAVPSPPHFQAPLLPVERAIFSKRASQQSGTTAAQKSGLRYEAKVQRELDSRYGKRYFPSKHIHFRDQRGWNTAVPDGLLCGFEWVAVIEIKSQHMPESWWQLRRKYEPVVRVLLPHDRIILVEICRALDKDMPYPERFDLIEELDKFLEHAPDGSLGVLQWRL